MTENEVLRIIPRVFHTINIHAQAEHRFSYLDPPLAQLPTDLEDIYIPDPGWPWFCWDWKQAEDWIIGILCQDPQFLKELAEGWDKHTILCVELFDLPPCPDFIDPHEGPLAAAWRAEVKWKGKEDLRRKLSKNLGHALKYGKDPKLAHHMPGFKAAGIPKERSIRGATRYLARYPYMLEWRARVADYALRTGEVRDFTGRRWPIFERDIEAVKRRAYNGPGQMGVSSIHNSVMDLVNQTFGEDVLFKWGKHDSHKWAIIEPKWDRITPGIK
ncbi:hypothetical protein LCGC14_1378120, partial [marine sediment metagenome]